MLTERIKVIAGIKIIVRSYGEWRHPLGRYLTVEGDHILWSQLDDPAVVAALDVSPGALERAMVGAWRPDAVTATLGSGAEFPIAARDIRADIHCGNRVEFMSFVLQTPFRPGLAYSV